MRSAVQTVPVHDEGSCHACAVIRLRHASGGTLDPNATVRPGDAFRASRTFVRLPDSAHEALKARLEALSLRDAVVAALDGASSLRLLQVPVDLEESFRDAHRRAAAVRDVPAAR